MRRRKPAQREQELPLDLVSSLAGPEESAVQSDLEAWLHGAIDRLPEKLRQPLALAALGELKLVQIAAVLGLPEGTVRRRIHTARQTLRAEMEQSKTQMQVPKGGPA